MAPGGELGAAWTDDFIPLHDSPKAAVEDCAAWESKVGHPRTHLLVKNETDIEPCVDLLLT